VPGQSGTRLIMCCMSMGEAAGTAAALSLKQGVTVRNVDVKKLQETIIANGGNLFDPTKVTVGGKRYTMEVAKNRQNGSESKFMEQLAASKKNQK